MEKETKDEQATVLGDLAVNIKANVQPLKWDIRFGSMTAAKGIAPLVDELKRLGEFGWEPVSIQGHHATDNPSDPGEWLFVIKRPRSDAPTGLPEGGGIVRSGTGEVVAPPQDAPAVETETWSLGE